MTRPLRHRGKNRPGAPISDLELCEQESSMRDGTMFRPLVEVLADHIQDREKCACGGCSFDWENDDLMLWPAQWAGHLRDVLRDELGIVDVHAGYAEFACKTCHAHYDSHASADLSCPAYTIKNGSVVFSEVHKYSGPLPDREIGKATT